MEGNFVTRYENRIAEWMDKIESDPSQKNDLENEMVQYMLEAMPYVDMYAGLTENVEDTNNPLNITTIKGVQKKDIYNEYLFKVENDNSSIYQEKSIKMHNCPICDSSNIICNTSCEDICRDCGCILEKLGTEMTYREEQECCEKVTSYSYKRENHFNEWLSQFQAQEVTTIPPEVITQLRSELKKMKIKNLKEITHAKVRGILKKIRLNKYYEHVPYITNILNGITPLRMTQVLEERLRQMFKDIQAPFDKHCPKNRKNFLSYSYVLYKFCELLGEDDYLPCFPLLKSKEKLYQQDLIWKEICDELRWEYIATI